MNGACSRTTRRSSWRSTTPTFRASGCWASTDLEAGDVYNVEEQVYVQKTGVDEAEKQSRLQGLKERLADLESDEAADLRADIDDLEDRIDAVLAAAD